MNNAFKLTALALSMLTLAACNQQTAAKKADTPAAASGAQAASAAKPAAAAASGIPAEFDTTAKQVSYAVGIEIGRSLADLKKSGFEPDTKIITQALEDQLAGKAKLSEQQVGEILNRFAQEQAEAAQQKALAAAKDNAAKGEAFLKDNSGKEGVKTTASGLQYKVNKEGTGAAPKAGDIVSVVYTGKLIDGTVFDSTDQHGHPADTFPLDGVIPGWTEGLKLMKEGGEYTLYIPSKLAYGERGQGLIPPGSTLVFDVKLVKTQKAPAAGGKK